MASHFPSPSSHLRAGAGAAPARLAYLLAASHSGSTLLAMLLGAHPDLCTVGELKATGFGNREQYRCSCRRLIQECAFWQRLGRAMSARGIPDFQITRAGTSIFEVASPCAQRLLAPLFRGGGLEWVRDRALSVSPAWRHHLRETQRRNLALVESLHELTGARWIIDSSKVALRLKYLLRIPSLEIKVIRVIRDGRAVALTYTDEASFADASDPALRGGGSGDLRVTAQNNMRDAANEWKRSNESADCLVVRLPRSQWTEVRYEELCRQPGAELWKLCGFLGIDPVKVNLDFRSREQHVIGNGMRLDSTSEIRLDERWKTHLTPDDLRIFDTVAGDLNRRYGYA
jgi:hypothetical protein